MSPQQKVLCCVPRTGVDFEHSFTDVWGETVENPSPKSRGTTKTLSSNHQIFIGRTSVEKTEFENEPEGFDTVSPVDVLTLGIGSAVVADRHLIDSCAPLGKAGGDLRLESESIAGQSKTLENISSHRLVTSLHVGEIEIVDHVRQQGENPVAQGMPEEKNTPLLTGGEPRAVNGISVTVDDRSDNPLIIGRVVFEISILNNRDVTCHLFDGGSDRPSFSHVHRLAEHLDARLRACKLTQNGQRLVCRAVVDTHQLDFHVDRSRENPVDDHLKRSRFVVDRHQNGKLHCAYDIDATGGALTSARDSQARPICDATLSNMRIIRWFRREQRWHIIALLFLLLPLFAWNARWDELANPDSEAAAIAAWQLSRNGTLDLSQYDAITENLDTLRLWFVPGRDNTIVSNRPPGLIGIALPSYLIAGSSQFSIVPSTVTAMALTMAALVIVWQLLRRLTEPGFATVATGVLALGTTTWAISSSELWPHGPDQFWASIALVGLSTGGFAVAGAAFALSLLTRPITAVFAAATGLLEAWRQKSARPALIIGAVSMMGLVLLLVYNWAIVGTLSVSGGYSASFTTGAVERFTLVDYLRNVFAMFIGPPNGFLLLSPILGVATFALIRYWKRVPGWARSGALAALSYLLVHAFFNRASGGLPVMYRYPLEAITLASAGLGFAAWTMARESQTGRRILLVTALLSIGIQGYYIFVVSCAVMSADLNTCFLT